MARLVLGVAPGTPRLLAWQAWHLETSTFVSRGRRAVGVAAVALGDIHLRFTWQAWYLVTSTSTLPWQAWHLWHWAGSGGALGFRRGAGDAAAVGVAGVALGDIHLRFEFRTDQFSPTYNIHVLVTADGQRLVLRAKLLYDPVYLHVPAVDDGKITPWNKQAYQEVCDAIQHASV